MVNQVYIDNGWCAKKSDIYQSRSIKNELIEIDHTPPGANRQEPDMLLPELCCKSLALGLGFSKNIFWKMKHFFLKSGETWIPGEYHNHVRRPSSRSLPWNYWSVIDNENDWGDVRFAIESTLILLILNILLTCDLLSNATGEIFGR